MCARRASSKRDVHPIVDENRHVTLGANLHRRAHQVRQCPIAQVTLADLHDTHPRASTTARM